jgi:hypothetical protein
LAQSSHASQVGRDGWSCLAGALFHGQGRATRSCVQSPVVAIDLLEFPVRLRMGGIHGRRLCTLDFGLLKSLVSMSTGAAKTSHRRTSAHHLAPSLPSHQYRLRTQQWDQRFTPVCFSKLHGYTLIIKQTVAEMRSRASRQERQTLPLVLDHQLLCDTTHSHCSARPSSAAAAAVVQFVQ